MIDFTFLEIQDTNNILKILLFGSLGMIFLATLIVVVIVINQKRINRYRSKLQKSEEEKQATLLRSSIQSQEVERQRLAADLHDDAGPLLASARLYMSESLVDMDRESQLSTISYAREIIDEAIALVRNLSHNLTPPTLKNFGLEMALTDFYQKISNSGKYQTKVRFHNYKDRLTLDQELLIFRIIQELTGNFLKHSSGEFISLEQDVSDGFMYFQIKHDGKGLSQEEFNRLNHFSTGLGLKNIESRVKILNGEITFENGLKSLINKITLRFPIHNPK